MNPPGRATIHFSRLADYMKTATVLLIIQSIANGQDYEVSNIKCHERASASGMDVFTATLKKPPGFRGHPVFADNRHIDPKKHKFCQILSDKDDPKEMTYYLSISDFSKCPLNEENEFLVVRIWFPQVPGIVLMNDQDVAIKCKPPEHVITKQQTAGFAGNIPSVGRVSGIVEKNPGKLEYMLQLYKESTIKSGNFEIPIDGAVNIGTMLQLKAVINTKSVWKYAKLLEVTISSDPSDPYAIGHVALVTDGCRVKDFESLMPKQPERLENQPGEVTLEFEAFMLDNMPVSGQLWIHAQIKACIDPADCIAEFCLDLFQPSGHGKKKRSTFNETRYFLEFPRIPLHRNVPSKLTEDATSNSANIGENIGITIVVPGADKKPLDGNSVSGFNCTPFLALSGVLSCMFFFAAILAGSMARKVHRLLQERRVSSLENVFSGKATPSNGFMSTIEGQKSVNFSLPQRNDAFGYMSTSPTKSF